MAIPPDPVEITSAGADNLADLLLNLYSGKSVAPSEVISVYVVFNGALGMSPGKLAAMAFHCGRRAGYQEFAADDWGDDWEYAPAYKAWAAQGHRVVVRVAETRLVFNRICAEVEGFAHFDEGLTEVPRGSCVAFISRPISRTDAPKVLSHKRCQLL